MKNLENYRRKCRKTNDTYLQFDNFLDLVAIVEENRSNYSTMNIGSCDSNYDFTKTHSMSEAIDLARYGWQEGIEKLNSKIQIKTQGELFTNKYDIAGGHVSVPRYLNGCPKNMIRKVPVENKDRVITIVKVCSVLGGKSVDAMIAEGAKFVQVIQRVEASGYRCNADVIFASSKEFQRISSTAHVVRVRIKKANERLNLAKMCFPMVHPSMFRRFIFKLREIDPVLKRQGWHGAGSSFYGNGYSREELIGRKMIERYLNKGDYLIPYTIDNPETFKIEEFKFEDKRKA